MQLKSFILILVLYCSAYSTQAQYLNIGGITVQATSTLYVDNGEAKGDACDQLYNISFKDLILAHNIYRDGLLDVSQIYQLSAINRYMDGTTTIMQFSALSGISGLTYKYTIKTDAAGKLISLVCTDSSGYKTTYKGHLTELKTFKQ